MDSADSQRISLPHGVEMDIAHVCNLHCRFCSHYSNYTLKGVVPLATAAPWLDALHRKVIPNSFYILGGEPTLNPDLCDYIWLVAELWPDIERGVVTNGLMLDRHPDLWSTLAETGTILAISRHSRSDQPYLDKFEPAMVKAEEMAKRHGVNLIRREGYYAFYRTYQGEGPGMRPFAEGNPGQSWTVCANRYCMSLYQGRLWKCPPIAFLEMVLRKFGLEGHEAWAPYLAYRGLDVHASMPEYAAFMKANFGPEPICGMCPTQLDFFEHEDVTTPFRAPGKP
ncbi:hypothetical protein A6A04_01840 [Paramagnetospirillum marisnigri]|uniref:Radical SAM core domain-containing protein n=1 Tax=Paramagnetospirillum marisnigri TaxID=1285242 RepID=A0A178MNC2_9PROT|nr:radical SAM protein [Paramagnetospirillum marisnigri]OAN50176.1 hypothetical protein A6A04_01840 [Paramagnetospirillum marisnigri]